MQFGGIFFPQDLSVFQYRLNLKNEALFQTDREQALSRAPSSEFVRKAGTE